jgi:N,N'-diacetylchitobiose transport system permease protein
MSRRTRSILVNSTGLFVAFLFAFPVYWMFITAFKTTGQIQTYTPVFIPTPTLDNIAKAISQPHFEDYLRNSVVVTLTTLLLSLVVGFLAAATVARARFHGKAGFLLLVAVAQMAPFEALLIPFYLFLRHTPIYGQLPSLVVVYFIFTLPFTIWSLRGFIAGVPVDLEEAAMVDGASRAGAFMRVTLPLLGPGLVATSIFGFITAWNEYFYAFVFMTDAQNYTLPVWLASFRTNFGTDWGATMAASAMFTLPVLAFFLIVQNRMVGGLTAGAVKG